MFSIIIPSFNEEKRIKICLESLKNAGEEFEVIIVDGGSFDKTVYEASSFLSGHKGKIIKISGPDLPEQLNRGANESLGDVLVFLHSDCKLAAGSLKKLKEIFKSQKKMVGGAFTMKVEGERFFYRILSIGGNIYCRLSKTFFGDRAIFVKKNCFTDLGGYRNIPIMADVDFSRRMKKLGKTSIVDGPVVSSSRKFDREPFWKIVFLILWALFSYRENADFEKIKKRYYSN